MLEALKRTDEMADFKTMFGNRIYILVAVILLGSGGLFAYLESQGLIIECEDKLVEVGVMTNISCSVYNPKARSIYLYNYGDWKIKFTPEIEDFGLYIKYYGKWRYTNFTMATRFGNIQDNKKYVFVFPARTTKEFQLRVLLNDTQVIKFDFGELDPLIVGYQYIYENKSRQVLVYEYKDIEIKPVYFTGNDTWSPGYNYTKRILKEYKTEYYKGDRKGLKIGDITINHPNINVNVEEGYIYECFYPVGKRNWDEFPMRQYEIDKGMCKKTDIIEFVNLK